MVNRLGNGRYGIVADGQHRLAFAASDGSPTWVFIDGRTWAIDAPDDDGQRRTHRVADDVALSAPMPAMVLAVKVTAGQDVQAGDVLIVLEAMKMELPITAPRAGRIKSIGCRKGELVQPGTPLLRYEAPAPTGESAVSESA